MDRENRYFILGGISSIVIYLLILLLIYIFLTQNRLDLKKYTSKRGNFIEVSLVSKDNENLKKHGIKTKYNRKSITKKRVKRIIKKSRKEYPKKITKPKEKPKAIKHKPTPKPKPKPKRVLEKPEPKKIEKKKVVKVVKDSKAKIKKIKKVEEPKPKKVVHKEKPKPKIVDKNITKVAKVKPKRVEKKPKITEKDIADLEKIFDDEGEKVKKSPTKGTLSDLAKDIDVEKIKSLGHDGIVDKFRGGINDYLQAKFEDETEYIQSGISAIVSFTIYKNGTFKYKIVKYSPNNRFNEKVKKFFSSLKKSDFQKFMPDFPKDMNKFEFETIVKDE